MNAPRVQFRQRAILDVDEIAAYIAQDNLAAARRFYDAVETTANRLAKMPGMGRPREFDNPSLANLRSSQVKSFKNFSIFYLPADAGIEVVRVLHGARNLDAIFEA